MTSGLDHDLRRVAARRLRRSRSPLFLVDSDDNDLLENPPFTYQRSRKKRKLGVYSEPQARAELLKLSVAYCDGGTYDGRRYKAQNVLADDTSVYCTNGSDCVMVLQHETTESFTLEWLEIKAPPLGFTSPIREGVISITDEANFEDALHNISLYQRSTIPNKASTRRNYYTRRFASNEAADGNDGDGGFATAPLLNDGDNALEHEEEEGDEDKDEEDDFGENPVLETDSMPLDYRTPMPLSPRNDCPWDEGENIEWGTESESDLTQQLLSSEGAVDIRMARRRREQQRMRRGRTNVEDTGRDAERKEGVGGQDNDRERFMRFSVSGNASVIVFDPPRYCRNIVLKLWGAKVDNLDIQAILGHGFYGKRQFPSTKMR